VTNTGPGIGPKRRVVILGGGVGAMTAAFDLSRGDWRSTFESITVYQVGWRLGGKGASGRGPGPGFPVREHGLHVWFGFYENAFRMMRSCYSELNRAPGAPLATFEEAFSPADAFAVQERRPDGWKVWEATFPRNDRLPGVPDDQEATPLLECMRQALHLAATLVSSAVPAEHGPPTRSSVRVAGPSGDGGPVATRPARGSLAAGIRREIGSAWRRLEPGARQLAHAALGAALELADEIDEDAAEEHGILAGLVEQAADWAKRYLRDKVEMSDAARRDWYVADVLMACVRGVLRHGVLSAGLEVIDGFEFTEWLILNGADEESARSAIMRTILYDLPFAYRQGDPNQPQGSASTALGGLLRLFFTYKGSIAWKMNAGMGDVVFGPLHDVLVARGVTFEFFHRVDKLHLSPDGRRVKSIDITRQVELDPSAGGTYDPLIDVPYGPVPRGGATDTRPAAPSTLRCWPASPKAALLHNGATLGSARFDALEHSVPGTDSPVGHTLHLDVDDDIVVLGISVGALDTICSELVAADKRWADMVDKLETVQTQSFQLWLSEPIATLVGSEVPSLTLGGYLEPFDTYADMSHLRSAEGFEKTRTIAYFTSVLPTFTGAAADAVGQAKATATRFLRDEMVALWPGGVERYPTDFKWDLLVVPDEHEAAQGVDRLDHQFFKANTDPSDGYVLSLPGTLRYRLRPGDSGFSNLVLAGDWTDCDINAGCVEAAVISGRLAACKITGESEDTIVGHHFHQPPMEGS